MHTLVAYFSRKPKSFHIRETHLFPSFIFLILIPPKQYFLSILSLTWNYDRFHFFLATMIILIFLATVITFTFFFWSKPPTFIHIFCLTDTFHYLIVNRPLLAPAPPRLGKRETHSWKDKGSRLPFSFTQNIFFPLTSGWHLIVFQCFRGCSYCI